jgi:stage II sporulation protein P
VIHDRTPHDKDDYLDAYDNARKATQQYLKQYPSIKLVLDLHRDAAEHADGTQWATAATVGGQQSAQLMFVVGTDAGGLSHPNWKENLACAEKLHVLMEKTAPGITRPIDLRSQRFNHDLTAAAMIVEVGSAGNTHPEAMTAIPVLAQAIIALCRGT